MPFAKINDAVMHYQVSGSGTPILFSNSLGTDLRIWDAVVEMLGDGVRTIRYDTRGHGLSEHGDAPSTIAGYAADVAGLLDFLEIESTVVRGLSVGGMIAISRAAARPDRVRGLVLCDTAPRIGTDEMWNERVKAIAEDGLEAHAGPILERWFSGEFRENQRHQLAAWRAMLVRTPKAGYLAVCAAVRDGDLTAQASAIGGPALCVRGGEDAATPPALVREMAAPIAESDFLSIDGAGHLPWIEQPAKMTAAIQALLKEKKLV
ncbi:MAG: 3-oxoadipate enol-lactonase [Proteobacteria bacterium]|nr:3-oxoadipate enol-lactonase [Pseudomonadota bacterium]